MILTCPSCATRYQVDEAKFPPAGRQVRCAKCGHSWFQLGPLIEPEPGDVMAAAEANAAPEPARAPEISNDGPEPEPVRPRAYATSSYTAPERERLSWSAFLAIAAGWAGLIAVVLLIGYSAVRYRQEISMLWPQSAGVYNSLGMNVNIHGLDIVDVKYHRESEDGQNVLAVTGKIINSGSHELSVPQSLRITLSDAANHDLYHWFITPDAKTLMPGKAVSFLTRLSSPPAGARHIEVAFPKEGL